METKTITAKGLDDGNISISIGPITTKIPAKDAGKIAVMVLQAGQDASYKSGFKPESVEDDGLNNVIGFVPDAVGATGPDKTTPASLVVAVGYARFALGMEPQALASLSRTLRTLSAGEARKN